MNYRIIILVIFLMLHFQNGYSQQDSSKIVISGYIETYYSYDLSNPASHEKPNLFYSYNRHNEFNLNLGVVKVQYDLSRLRSSLALMVGTYAQYNLATETEVMRHVYEATIGLKMSKKHNLWIDTGVLPSHIGFESARGGDCWTLSRSLSAENTPYYEAGARLSYTSKTKKAYLAFLLLNGWQHISRPVGNNTLAFGTQATYTPSVNATYNWSTFVGNETADTAQKWRFFNNFYVVRNLSKRWGITLGLDYGMQQHEPKSKKQDIWYSTQVIGRLKISPIFCAAARAEYYYDPNSVITNLSAKGAKVSSVSFNLDYLPPIKGVKNLMFRNEIRGLYGKNPYFLQKKGSNSAFWTAFTSSLLVEF